MLPIPGLQRAQRRAGHLSELDAQKWELPVAGTLPRWDTLPLDRCTITKAASQAMSSQLASLEGYADSAPVADLVAMAGRKAAQAQAQAQQLADLKALFDNSSAHTNMQARLIGPGNAGELRRQLLAGEAPGHEWPLSAGLMLVGSLSGLSFVRELVGL
ncbi:hypothetical protein D3C77_287370 [compost metagenome]